MVSSSLMHLAVIRCPMFLLQNFLNGHYVFDAFFACWGFDHHRGLADDLFIFTDRHEIQSTDFHVGNLCSRQQRGQAALRVDKTSGEFGLVNTFIYVDYHKQQKLSAFVKTSKAKGKVRVAIYWFAFDFIDRTVAGITHRYVGKSVKLQNKWRCYARIELAHG